jgi:hypothetical protein
MSAIFIAVAAAIISAVAAVSSAAISAFTSWSVSRRGASQKLAEMREAWIDDLRNHLAEFVGVVHQILNEATNSTAFGGQAGADQKTLQGFNANLSRVESYITIKLNAEEEAAHRLIDVMGQLRGGAAMLSNYLEPVIVPRLQAHLGEFQALSSVIVKSEWQRVKNDIKPVSQKVLKQQQERVSAMLAQIPNTCEKYQPKEKW